MTNKMTNRKALEYVLSNCEIPTEVSDKLNAMIVALDKRNSGERKPTAKQTENERIRAEIVEYINANMSGDGFTCADLIKYVPCLADKSNQYVSAIMRQAWLADEVSKQTVKRRTYFIPFNGVSNVAEVEAE